MGGVLALGARRRHDRRLRARDGRAAPGTLPLQTFLAYGDWFRERFVRDADPADVARIEPNGRGLRVTSDAGEEQGRDGGGARRGRDALRARAAAVRRGARRGRALATERLADDELQGRRVAVIGGGQNALESAGIAARAGADVELLVRTHVRWFADREPRRRAGRSGAAPTGSPIRLSATGHRRSTGSSLHPDLFAALPAGLRLKLNRRLLRAGGSPWLRSLVEGKVRVTEGVAVERLEQGDPLRLHLDDGTVREVDLVLLGTGYRFDAAKLGFLDEKLARAVRTERSWPVLDRSFRSPTSGSSSSATRPSSASGRALASCSARTSARAASAHALR